MSDPNAFLRPDGLRVTHRRMVFDFEQGFPRYWHGGSAFKSLFWAQLSTAFGSGERFFMDSARALKSVTSDRRLLEEVDEFVKQEAQHTAQHLKFDAINADMGIDVGLARRRFDRILRWARRQTDAMEMLAVTCALEHFTAGFADSHFRNPAISAGADPRVNALWAWHAAEEAEHRATCFDLYRAARGGYFQRVATMLISWLLIIVASLINTFILVVKERTLFSFDTLRGLAYLFGPRGVFTSLAPAFFAYFNPRFHPWKGADAADITKWQAENARYIKNHAA